MEEVGDLSLESMEDEEVVMVDGVFEGEFGALGEKTCRFVARREDHHLVEKKWECLSLNLIRNENDILAFDVAVQLDTFQLKKSTNIVESRKIALVAGGKKGMFGMESFWKMSFAERTWCFSEKFTKAGPLKDKGTAPLYIAGPLSDKGAPI
ncbi:hypothetical protein Tco_0088572 [Tanacetum coccineum]